MRELGDRTLEQVACDAKEKWNDVLGRIEVEDNDADKLRTFYSCLYRSVLFQEVSMKLMLKVRLCIIARITVKFCQDICLRIPDFGNYFRCLFPFLNLMYPSVNVRIQEGLANAYKESGFLPEWASPGHRGCMVGNNSASVVSDAWMKGLGDMI